MFHFNINMSDRWKVKDVLGHCSCERLFLRAMKVKYEKACWFAKNAQMYLLLGSVYIQDDKGT